MTPKPLEEANDMSWMPEASCRPDGFEALAFHRGKWINVRWSTTHKGWSLGYGMPFIQDGERPWAPLPENTPPAHLGEPKGPYGFFGWKS